MANGDLGSAAGGDRFTIPGTSLQVTPLQAMAGVGAVALFILVLRTRPPEDEDDELDFRGLYAAEIAQRFQEVADIVAETPIPEPVDRGPRPAEPAPPPYQNGRYVPPGLGDRVPVDPVGIPEEPPYHIPIDPPASDGPPWSVDNPPPGTPGPVRDPLPQPEPPPPSGSVPGPPDLPAPPGESGPTDPFPTPPGSPQPTEQRDKPPPVGVGPTLPIGAAGEWSARLSLVGRADRPGVINTYLLERIELDDPGIPIILNR